MNATEIIAAIDAQDDALPREALEAAMARPEEVTGALLELVAGVARAPEKVLDPDNRSMGCVIALYLLAQFRETRALPLLAEALALPGVDMDDLFGDVMISDMARILASVSGGETGPLHSLIEDPEVHPLARRSALHALYSLVYRDVIDRRNVVRYLGELYRDKLERRPSEVWTDLVETTSWIGPEELYDDIQRAYEEGLLVGDRVDYLMEEVDQYRAWGLEAGAPRVVDNGDHFLIDNTLEEIGYHAYFSAETRLGFEHWEAAWASDQPMAPVSS